MAGRLTISTLNNDTGVLAVANGMTGIAKAWVEFNGVTTVTVRGSYNVSSVTRASSGDYTINFTTAMPNANYSVVGTCSPNITGSKARMFTAPYATAPSTSAVRCATADFTGAFEDQQYVNVAVFSS